MDSAQWTQDFGVTKSMAAEISSPPGACTKPIMERKIRPQKEQALNCPRCNSTNTKFCYYNNYSLTQPRYFCKTCRRYWTQGGTLRNVPVGGGSRRNKKSATSLSQTLPDLNPPSISPFSNQNPNKNIHDQGPHDLNLGFQGPMDYQHGINIPQSSTSSCSSSSQISALNFLRNGINAARGFNSFIPMAPSALESTNALFHNFPFQECKPNVSFSIDGNRFENPNVAQENVNGSLMFSLGGATKRDSSTSEDDHQGKGHGNSNGFWNGMLGGGSW